jgi:nucleoside-diphosphate-sugar epimerase
MIETIKDVRANRVVLFSTVDVFEDSRGKTESSSIGFEPLAGYGRNRRFLEKRVQEIWPDALIIRLPGLVGPGLQKNALFDLKALNQVEKLNPEDVFQFYPMVNVSHDMHLALKANLRVAHLVSEPISLGRIAVDVFRVNLASSTERPAVYYDLQTGHSEIFGGFGNYTYSARESLTAIRAFAQAV